MHTGAPPTGVGRWAPFQCEPPRATRARGKAATGRRGKRDEEAPHTSDDSRSRPHPFSNMAVFWILESRTRGLRGPRGGVRFVGHTASLLSDAGRSKLRPSVSVPCPRLAEGEDSAPRTRALALGGTR